MSLLTKIIFYISSLLFTSLIFADQAEYSYIPPNHIYYESEKNDDVSSKNLSRILSPGEAGIMAIDLSANF